RSGPAQGQKGPEKEETLTPRGREILEFVGLRAVKGRSAGQTLQQGTAAVAPARLPAEDRLGGGEGPLGHPQATDGRVAHPGRREDPRSDVADAGEGWLCHARTLST